MKTHKFKTLKIIVIIAAALLLGVVSFSVAADGKSGRGSNAQLIYVNQAHGPFIYSYVYSYSKKIAEEISLKPELVYVSQANGPSIYSYKHSNIEKSVPWNVQYVDTAYGPAIYSYEPYQNEGEVKVLPIIVN